MCAAEPKAKNKPIQHIQAPPPTPDGIAYWCLFQSLGQDAVYSLFIIDAIVWKGNFCVSSYDFGM